MKTRIFCDGDFFHNTSERKISDDNIKAIIKFFVSSPDSFVFPFSKKEYHDFVNMPQYSDLIFLIKKWNDSRIAMCFNRTIDVENNIDKADEVTLYFGSNSLCQKAKQYGEMCVNLDESCDFTDLLVPDGFVVQKGDDKFNWNTSFNDKMPSKTCNSMVFVDNYISTEVGMMNLKCILDSLLPESLSVEFHLTVVTLEDGSVNSDIQENKIRKELELWLLDRRPDVNFEKLEILLIKKVDNHDRYILTNNYSIYCAGGFDQIKKNKSTRTTTSVGIEYPFIRINPYKYEKYINYIGNIKKCFKIRNKISKNRLL